MKILKKIAVGLLILIGLILIVGLFLPATMHIEQSQIINAKPSVVFEQVNTVKNMEKWSPWEKDDSLIVLTYNDIPSGKGAMYSWVSPNKNTGSGSSVITQSVPEELITSDLDFHEHGKASSGFKFEKVTEGTRVTWYFDSEKNNNPFAKVMMSAFKGMMNNTFSKGLADLKALIEKSPEKSALSSDIKVEMTTVNKMDYLAVRDTASISTISMKIGQNFGLIGKAMQKQKLKESYYPFAIYYSDSKTNWEFDACIAVDKEAKPDGKVKPGKIQPGNAVVAHYFGDYMGTAKAYEVLQAYIKSNNKNITGAPWEVYVTDPMAEKDTAKWQTDVYFPVE